MFKELLKSQRGRERQGFWLVLLLAFLPGNPAVAAEFILFSDLHDTGASHGQPGLFATGHDADETLIASALQSARTNCAAPPQFILCLGDILAHANERPAHYSPTNVQSQVANLFKSVFPGVPVFNVLGNNDSDTADGSPGDSDYLAQPPAFLDGFARAWSDLIPDPADRARVLETFTAHGWYYVNLPGLAKVRLVALDSTYFESKSLQGHDRRDTSHRWPALQIQATNQFIWLSNQVSQARRDGVTLWLAFHIPPGLDPYQTNSPLWERSWNNALVNLITTYPDTIGAIFCGHTHSDEFRLIYAGGQPVAFVHVVPSISPIHKNNPAYQIFETDPQTARLLDCRTYCLTNPAAAWSEEYSFTNQYTLPDYSLQSLKQLRALLETSSVSWSSYTDSFSSGASGGRGALADRRRYLNDQQVTVEP